MSDEQIDLYEDEELDRQDPYHWFEGCEDLEPLEDSEDT